MRRVRQCADRRDLAVFERIIELYGPYVLIRCAGYTNSRRQSQQIGAHVLICTCLTLRKLDRPGQLGILVEVMLEVVGPDVVSGGDGAVRQDEVDEPLIVDRRMRKIAEALNRLERPLREAIVLHHIGGMGMGELTGLLQKPRGEVEASLEQGEELLADWLRGPRASGHGADASDMRSLLAEFAAGLDADWIQEVVYCAMAYLTREVERTRRRSRRGLN